MAAISTEPSHITPLGLTKRSWDDLRGRIICALNAFARSKSGGLIWPDEWEAWLDRFLDGGIGERFWPGDGSAGLAWNMHRDWIHEAVRVQVLLIYISTQEAGGRLDVLAEGSGAVGIAPSVCTALIGNPGSYEQHVMNLEEEPVGFLSGRRPINDKTDPRLSVPGRKPKNRKSQIITPKDNPDLKCSSKDLRTGDVNTSYRTRKNPTRSRKSSGWVSVNEIEPDQNIEDTHNTQSATRKRPASKLGLISTPNKKRNGRKPPIVKTLGYPIELSSDSISSPESISPPAAALGNSILPRSPVITPTTSQVVVIPAATITTATTNHSTLVFSTRLAASSNMKPIYATDTPSLSHFLAQIRNKWTLSDVQQVNSVEVEIGSKIFDLDLGEERDWRVVLEIAGKWGKGVGVVFEFA